MFDLPAADAIEHEVPGLSVVARLADTEPIAAALPKDSTNAQAVGAALRAMDADGTIDRLAERWLGTSLQASADNTPLLRTDQT
jgi:ABC-type amino acid transport substrate-binding protein